jgi:hypothetical protein
MASGSTGKMVFIVETLSKFVSVVSAGSRKRVIKIGHYNSVLGSLLPLHQYHCPHVSGNTFFYPNPCFSDSFSSQNPKQLQKLPRNP